MKAIKRHRFGGLMLALGLAVAAQGVSAASLEAHEPYAPSDLSYLRSTGYDYWALGHVHRRQELSRTPGIHYPGNPQGRNPGETGPKGGLLVELSGRGAEPSVRFVELAPLRWSRLVLGDLEDVDHLRALVARATKKWKEERSAESGRLGMDWVIRVELLGPSPLHSVLKRPEEQATLREELMSALDALEVEVRAEALRPPLDPTPYLDRQDVVGEALRLARALAEGRGDVVEALELAGSDLAGLGDRPLEEYASELLSHGDRELRARFIEGGKEAP